MKLRLLFFLVPCLFAAAALPAADFKTDIAPLFAKHCLACHGHDDPDGGLVLERHASLLKGGESGVVVVAGKSADSLLVRMIEGKTKSIMPPGKRKKLEPGEIEAIRKWIDAGALAPADDSPIVAKPDIPKIKPKVPPKKPILAITESIPAKLVAIARRGDVELRESGTLALKFKLAGHAGAVNALAFSNDGKMLASVAGTTGISGEIKLWNTADGKLVKTWTGHSDALYSVAISPDGTMLATGSYDQKIKLWNIEKGDEIRTLDGHNGAVFSLAFRPDGKVLASASGDRTIKLWDPATGERLETFGQPLKEQYALAFSPDGTRLAAGGGDNRIRLWKIGERAIEGSNPMQEAVFAHDGAVLKLVFSPDGKTLYSSGEDRAIKSWDAEKVTQKAVFDAQPDWATGLAISADGKSLLAGRLDGSFALYDAASGKDLKPELTALSPRGIQRGAASRVKLSGKNLLALVSVNFSAPKIKAEILPDSSKSGDVSIRVTADADFARGNVELSVSTAAGETLKQTLYVDDLKQTTGIPSEVELPVTFWGEFAVPGEVGVLNFDAKAGQTIVFDAATASLKSKARLTLRLSDSGGRRLAPLENDVNAEPLLAFKIPADGRYNALFSEASLAGSKEHFYRVSIGELAVVNSYYPLAVQARAETEIQLRGYNLPPNFKAVVKAGEPGDAAIPLDRNVYRTRSALKALAIDLPEVKESEPNDSPAQATAMSAPGAAEGRLFAPEGGSDVDLYRFETKAGRQWIVETVAAQRGSPADTKLEILDAAGRPVPRVQLRAVRDSYLNFRGIDSVIIGARLKNWEEMELDNYVYMQGEVCKLFRMPQGPDSDLNFYKAANGARRCYFDTSATSHANEETVYIVEPHAPNEKLISNGLPVFMLNYVNDDDGERKLGSDSRLHFTAPADGAYLVRVSDARGESGENFVYHLAVREPKPDFTVSVSIENRAVNAGSGRMFTLAADRVDDYEGAIRVDIAGMPPGFSVSTPIVIQAGHREAFGTFFSDEKAASPTDAALAAITLTASADVNGKAVVKTLPGFGSLTVAPPPKLFVMLEPYVASAKDAAPASDPEKPLEVTIAPGETIPVWLKVRRNGHEDLITFSVENLPHGVIVDNIGLSGVLLEKGLSERQIFLSCERWVPDTDRLCFAVENQAGKQTSRPVMLHVRRSP